MSVLARNNKDPPLCAKGRNNKSTRKTKLELTEQDVQVPQSIQGCAPEQELLSHLANSGHLRAGHLSLILGQTWPKDPADESLATELPTAWVTHSRSQRESESVF